MLKKQIRDSETLRKKFETPRPKETHEKRDFVTRHKSIRDFEIGTKISEIHDFLGTIRHPYKSSDGFQNEVRIRLSGLCHASGLNFVHLNVIVLYHSCLAPNQCCVVAVGEELQR